MSVCLFVVWWWSMAAPCYLFFSFRKHMHACTITLTYLEHQQPSHCAGLSVEEKIQLAMAQGDFDNLPGKGKPLERFGDSEGKGGVGMGRYTWAIDRLVH